MKVDEYDNGLKIKFARERKGVTQKNLADKLGISQNTVSQWENNIRRPKIQTLGKIARALNIDIMEIAPIEYRPTDVLREFAAYTSRRKEAQKLILIADSIHRISCDMSISGDVLPEDIRQLAQELSKAANEYADFKKKYGEEEEH